MTPVAQSIYKTLAFFDAHDMPLTLTELRAYLVRGSEFPLPETSLLEVDEAIGIELSDFVSKNGGFYFLTGREHLVESRNNKYRNSLRYFRKAKKYLYPLKFFPYLQAVAISGSQALLNSSEKSDIDLFLLTRKNRVWLTRFLVSLYFQVIGQRRYGNHIRGRFCLNHYVTENLCLKEDQNLYTAGEYINLIPVFGQQRLKEFYQQNTWVKNFYEKPVIESVSPFFDFNASKIGKIIEIILEGSGIGPFLNWVSGVYQKKRIRMQEHILVSDQELSFHPGSRGQKVLAKFTEKLVRHEPQTP